MNVTKLVRHRPSLLSACQSSSILVNSSRYAWFDREKKSFFRKVTDRDEPTFFSETEPNPLSDVERRIEESKQRMKWRQPVTEKSTFLTEGLRFFAIERTRPFFEIIRRPFDRESMLNTLEMKRLELMITDQRFIADRHRILGNDLAAAHFLVARGGQVKFTRSNEWVKKNKHDEYNLPRTYDPEWLIFAIKADNMELYFEGLENVRRLNHLRYFSLRNVKQFDDWSMDRLCGNEFDNIEILDVSGTSVTANALFAVPKLRSLKALVMDTKDRSIEFQLACSLLEEVMPHLKILDSADVHDDVYEAQKVLEAKQAAAQKTNIKQTEQADLEQNQTNKKEESAASDTSTNRHSGPKK